MILGIETAGGRCGVALVDGARVLRRLPPTERGHAEVLIPLIEELLAEAGAVWRDLTRIGVCTGPGSFTGIRAGVAAARGLALGLGVPAVGIGRLEALAAEAEAGRPAVVLAEGPGGTLYVQEFDAAGRAEGPPCAAGAEFRPAGGRVLVGRGGILPDALPDPAVIARLAAGREPAERPAPLYLRDAGAAPPREAPPPILDP